MTVHLLHFKGQYNRLFIHRQHGQHTYIIFQGHNTNVFEQHVTLEATFLTLWQLGVFTLGMIVVTVVLYPSMIDPSSSLPD